jgi:hypothetical protein
MNRITLINIHMLLAAFMFPVALMFLVTGGLYTWDIKGGYETETFPITLAQPLNADASALRTIVEAELERRGIASPTGSASVKSGGTSFKLEWTGSNRDAVLEPTDDLLVAKLSVKETSWYRQFVQLHKAKGGRVFKVYAAALAVSLFTILASGFWLALQVPKLRRLAVTTAVSGVGVFVLVVLTS